MTLNEQLSEALEELADMRGLPLSEVRADYRLVWIAGGKMFLVYSGDEYAVVDRSINYLSEYVQDRPLAAA